MAITRQSALVTHEHRDFGGSYVDSFTYARMFKSYGPYNFGIKVAQLFSQEIGSHLINKKFTHYTIAQGNMYVLPGGVDDYQWFVGSDAEVEFRFTEFLGLAADQPGKGGLPFKIAIDQPWLHEPAVLRLNGGFQLPLLRILGHSTQRSANSFEYEVVIQDGDLNAYIPVAELAPDKTCVRVTSLVSDELNTKYAPDSFVDMFKLQSWVSNYANKAEFTDKAIRMEIGARNSGMPAPTNQIKMKGQPFMKGNAFTSGFLYQADVRNKNQSKVITVGHYVTAIEARLEERTQMDREMAMTFARLEKTVDRDSGRIIKVAPGWEQISRDGHYYEHNGSLSLDLLFEFLNGVFLNKRSFKDRKIKLSGGEAAIRWLNKLIYAEYAATVNVDSHFTRPNPNPSGYSPQELQFGAQFTSIILPNGIEVSIDYDPMKDDKSIYKLVAPGTNSTLESYSLDIFDFGVTDQNAQGADTSNICMVMQDGVEEKYQIGNVYNFETGAIDDGSNAFGNNKELGLYRAMSGSLCVWDCREVKIAA